MKLATDLIWLARAELGGEYIDQVDMGDSANHGYACPYNAVVHPESAVWHVSIQREVEVFRYAGISSISHCRFGR